MDELRNKPEPKKIKMPPLVDRSKMYDTIGWHDIDEHWIKEKYEDNNENNSQGLPELESL
jgi:hypothetical protein